MREAGGFMVESGVEEEEEQEEEEEEAGAGHQPSVRHSSPKVHACMCVRAIRK